MAWVPSDHYAAKKRLWYLGRELDAATVAQRPRIQEQIRQARETLALLEKRDGPRESILTDEDKAFIEREAAAHRASLGLGEGE